MDLLSAIYDGRIMIINKDYAVISDSYHLAENKTVLSSEVIAAMQGVDVSNYDGENAFIEVVVPVEASETGEVLGVILASVSSTDITMNIEYMSENAMVLGFAVLILVTIVAVFGSARIVRPFIRMSENIEKMQTSMEEAELSILDYEETRKVSYAFNDLIARMKQTEESRQEFVSNVSHELKTPLTSMKVLADSLNSQEDVPAELYREFMEDIAAEIDRENNIINDLLTLVKLDRTNGEININSVNINELIELVLKRLRPIAARHNIEVVFETQRNVIAEVDEVKMTQVITNLVENAIKYNTDDGWVHVTLNADAAFFYITVEDGGMGIDEESLPHIFERFYRADKSHSREIGGTGLGLAITRSAVLLHRGTIKVDSQLGNGTTFSLRIPLNYRTK